MRGCLTRKSVTPKTSTKADEIVANEFNPNFLLLLAIRHYELSSKIHIFNTVQVLDHGAKIWLRKENGEGNFLYHLNNSKMKPDFIYIRYSVPTTN